MLAIVGELKVLEALAFEGMNEGVDRTVPLALDGFAFPVDFNGGEAGDFFLRFLDLVGLLTN